MSVTYDFDKTPVNLTKLILEILDNPGITKTLEGRLYNEDETPTNLHLTFADDLGDEETALNTTVTNHDGNLPTIYSYFCYDCGLNYSDAALSTPTQCLHCSSLDIQSQFHKCTYIATRDPTVDDDITQGFCEGSDWVNATDRKAFTCMDNSVGEADWARISLPYVNNTTYFLTGKHTLKVPRHEQLDNITGGSYHQETDVVLAGETPVDADVAGWSDGDRGHGIGTTGQEFYMVKRGTTVKSIEMT